jgi:4-hydroxy-tetrahydrodipicolinate synthase
MTTASASRPRFEGCYTALVTPMSSDGAQVDLDALTRLVEWQIDSGVDGLIPVGTTGESATLDIGEHVAVIRHVVKVVRGRVPVIAGAGGNATAEAIALSRQAADAGADGLLHVTPYYNRPTQEGLFRHFEAIARATTLPIVLYNVPARTSCDLLPDTVVRLAELDNIVAIKEATGSLPRATELIGRLGDRLTVLSGDDPTAFPLYAVGARGVISVVSNVAPADMAAMWDAAAAGDWARARALHHKLRVLIGLMGAETNPIPVKACLALMGRIQPGLRLPLVAASSSTVDALRAQLAALGMA